MVESVRILCSFKTVKIVSCRLESSVTNFVPKPNVVEKETFCPGLALRNYPVLFPPVWHQEKYSHERHECWSHYFQRFLVEKFVIFSVAKCWQGSMRHGL